MRRKRAVIGAAAMSRTRQATPPQRSARELAAASTSGPGCPSSAVSATTIAVLIAERLATRCRKRALTTSSRQRLRAKASGSAPGDRSTRALAPPTSATPEAGIATTTRPGCRSRCREVPVPCLRRSRPAWVAAARRPAQAAGRGRCPGHQPAMAPNAVADRLPLPNTLGARARPAVGAASPSQTPMQTMHADKPARRPVSRAVADVTPRPLPDATTTMPALRADQGRRP